MDIEEFVQWLCCRDRHDIEGSVRALESARGTAEGEVCRLRATRELGVTLRRAGRTRQAGEAAHRAAVAAMGACRSTGLCDADRTSATLWTRAAADAAVGLVVGEQTPSTEAVLRPFFGSMVLTAS